MGMRLGAGSAASLSDFRRRVPITTYDDYAEAIEACKSGAPGAMLGPGQQILMFALSSGTTGQPKYIPITKKFLNEYRRGWLTWGSFAYRGRSILIETALLPITSSACEFRTPSGIACGAISGLTVDSQSWITKHLFPVPPQVYRIKDTMSKFYCLGRFAIEKRVGSISTANPSTVLSVFRLLNERKEALIRDVHDGTLDKNLDLEPEARRVLQSLLKPNPRRASRLQQDAEAHGGLYPKDFWKDLCLVSNWKGGSLMRYLDFYPEFFGDIEIRDIGLVASEGRMTIPVSHASDDGILDIRSHFFEFVPEAAIEDKQPRTLLAQELQVGERYYVLLTTSSGFYRYDIRDLVEVTGFRHQAPMLRFLNKGKHFCSITGEKISEHQVVQAVAETSRRFEMRIENYCLFPKWGKIPFYGMLVEENSLGASQQWGPFLRALDSALRRLNCEYDSKRSSGRLGGINLFFVPERTFELQRQDKLRAQGGRMEQYKHVFLVPDEGVERHYRILREFSSAATVAHPV